MALEVKVEMHSPDEYYVVVNYYVMAKVLRFAKSCKWGLFDRHGSELSSERWDDPVSAANTIFRVLP